MLCVGNMYFMTDSYVVHALRYSVENPDSVISKEKKKKRKKKQVTVAIVQMTSVLLVLCGLSDFCCPQIPFYWEPIFHLVFLDRVFFYFKQFLNKILYFKSEKKRKENGEAAVFRSAFCVLVRSVVGITHNLSSLS